MEHLTPQQRCMIIKTFYQNGSSIVKTRRKLRDFFGLHHIPSKSTVQRVIKNFETRYTLQDLPKPGRARTARTPQNIATVRQNVEACPETSVRRRAQEVGISQTSLWKILRKDLKFYPYKIQITQTLQENDHERRREWSARVLQLNADEPEFCANLIMTDEAHFDLSGYVNQQNSRYWGLENPRLIHERPLHPRRVTVWCAIWAGGIIGPFFFEDDAGSAVTVTAERYRAMLENFFLPEVNRQGLQQMWFQQDGATAHTARATMEILHDAFPGRVMSNRGDIDWPPRSPDLTAPDFFLWGYLKDRVYTHRPTTIQELKVNIHQEIEQITQEVCQHVMQNVIARARICAASRGGHLADIIFHT